VGKKTQSVEGRGGLKKQPGIGGNRAGNKNEEVLFTVRKRFRRNGIGRDL